MLFQNICRDVSRVQDCWNLAKTRVRTKRKYALRPNAAYLNSQCHTCLVKKKTRTVVEVLLTVTYKYEFS